jgi:hypothetical protein
MNNFKSAYMYYICIIYVLQMYYPFHIRKYLIKFEGKITSFEAEVYRLLLPLKQMFLLENAKIQENSLHT